MSQMFVILTLNSVSFNLSSFLFVCLFVCFVLLCYVMLCFVLFCFVLFCFVSFCFVFLFCFVLFCFCFLFCLVLFCFGFFSFNIKQILSRRRLQTVLMASTRRLKKNGRGSFFLESLPQIMLAFTYLQQAEKMEASSHGESIT